MSVSTFGADDIFTFRVVKSHISNPDNKWVNTYEFQAVGGGSEDELLTLGLVLVEFEIAMHLAVVNFERLLISTWEEDSVPYNPAAFISSTLTGVGAANFSTDPLGLHNTLSVTRQCAFGRFGHIFYRGTLEESQTSAPAGKTILTNRVTIQGSLDAALAASGLDDYIGTAPAGAFRMVLVGKTAGTARPVVALRAQGVSAVPMDHAWFNRANTP